MIIGYIFIGFFAGLIAAAIAAVSGASVWLVCSLYVLVGTVVMALLAGIRILMISIVQARLTQRSDEGADDVEQLEMSELGRISRNKGDEAALRILAVDDDPFILELIAVIAGHAGLTNVVSVGSSEHALRVLANPGLTFDYFLFDIRMPGLDGIELCRRVRQMPRYRDTLVTMLTGMRDVAYMNEAFRAGASDYVMKPFEVADLELRLRLAQDAYMSGYDAQAAPSRRSEGTSLQLITDGFERLGGLWHNRRHHLVDRVALSNYLTQVPQKELGNVSVFAVIIGGSEASHMAVSEEARTVLHNDIAAAAAESLGPDLAIMAYTRDADLLIVTHCTHRLHAISLELDITRRLSNRAGTKGATNYENLVISVGVAVRLQGAKEGRATFATDRALMLAEDRIADKQGRSLTALHKS